MKSDLIVRPYQPADQKAVFQIGADTAFFGAPIEAYMEDRRIFNDFFYAYYTDVEPQYTWVAVADGKVAGFLAGCLDVRSKYGRWLVHIFPRFMACLLRGGYHFGPLAWHYIGVLISAGLHGEAPHIDFKKFPAHLHINVDAAWRGLGLGHKLMDAYLAQLRSLGVRGVHLETTSMNDVACRLYEKVGFRLLDARPTRMWVGMIDGPVENRCYGLKL
jgi:ribosomal protein S18 acetylase RimI-like enzyme